MKRVATCAALMGLALSAGVAEAKAEPEVSFNAAITSDYVFRGFSQTDVSPALQGGADVSLGRFYAGVWASQVDFGDETDAEFDVYGGVLWTALGIDWDLGALSYNYINAPNFTDYDIVEFKLTGSRRFGPVTAGAGVYYSPDFSGPEKEATYVEGNLAYAIKDGIEISGAYGKQFLDLGDDYEAWNAGVLFNATDKISLDLRYWDSTVDGRLSEDRLVFTVGTAF